MEKHVQFRPAKSVDEAITLTIEYEAFEGPKTIFRKPTFEEIKFMLFLNLSKFPKLLKKSWPQLFQKI